MLRRVLIGLCLLTAVCGGGAQAQTADRNARIRNAIALALSNIQHARCAATVPCEPATPAELTTPPLTLEEGGMVLRRGTINGVAKACGLEWREQSFSPMMSRWRELGKSDRQLALIGILHGMAQAQAEAKMAAMPCDDSARKAVSAQLSLQP